MGGKLGIDHPWWSLVVKRSIILKDPKPLNGPVLTDDATLHPKVRGKFFNICHNSCYIYCMKFISKCNNCNGTGSIIMISVTFSVYLCFSVYNFYLESIRYMKLI